MSFILGVSDSHLSHACLFQDGVLIASIAEERLTRRKAEMGFPINSLQFLFEKYGLSPDNVDNVFVAGKAGLPYIKIYRRDVNFQVKDWIKQNEEFFYPKLMLGKNLTARDDFEMFKHVNPDLSNDPLYPFIEKLDVDDNRSPREKLDETYYEIFEEKFSIPRKKIEFIRHEDCHKAYAVFSKPSLVKKSLIFTCEGGGDDSSATLSVFEQGKFTEIWSSNECSLGRLYRNATIYLGMKPGQDEYKIMGLAPYASSKQGQKALEFFREVDEVDGLSVTRQPKHLDLFAAMKERLKGVRFDGVAWGLQTYLEETLLEWMENAISETGISNVIFSGGVAQNIKAMKTLAESSKVTDFWVGPITGDGSLGVGAAVLGMAAKGQLKIKQLNNPYLGTLASDENVEHLLNDSKFLTKIKYSPEVVADLIASGKIIATCRGRSEFGMRALGNRSILADPRDFATIDRINEKVKLRDFWMPFTPSFLSEEVENFLISNACKFSPYMTMAYDTKPHALDFLRAVVHPRDKTARPQFVTRETNQKYYDEIKCFSEKSGVPALLNTSFNLHGEPLVETVEQAIEVMGRCDIDALVLEHSILVRS